MAAAAGEITLPGIHKSVYSWIKWNIAGNISIAVTEHRFVAHKYAFPFEVDIVYL